MPDQFVVKDTGKKSSTELPTPGRATERFNLICYITDTSIGLQLSLNCSEF